MCAALPGISQDRESLSDLPDASGKLLHGTYTATGLARLEREVVYVVVSLRGNEWGLSGDKASVCDVLLRALRERPRDQQRSTT